MKKIDMDFELSDLVPEGEFELDKGFCQRREFHPPSSKRVQQIRDTYEFRLPGKFLFQILARFLNIRGRDFNFNVTERGLYDIALTMPNSHLPLNALIQEIEEKLDAEEKRIAETKPAIFQQRKVSTRKYHRVEPKRTTKQPRKPKSKQNQTWKPRNTKPSQPSRLLQKPKFKVGDKVNAAVLKNDGIKVTVQLQTDYKEELVFERPYYPKQVGNEVKLRVTNVDSTGKVSKVIP